MIEFGCKVSAHEAIPRKEREEGGRKGKEAGKEGARKDKEGRRRKRWRESCVRDPTGRSEMRILGHFCKTFLTFKSM